MRPAELQFTLRQLPEHLRDVLDDSARRVVEQAATSLDTVIDRVHLIENTMKAASTNNIHGLYWKAGVPAHIRRAIISLSVSTIFQLSAEIVGRYYGGGLLKIEPSDALNLVAIETSSRGTFERIDSALERQSMTEATQIADLSVAEALHLSDSELNELRESLRKLRCLRVPSRRIGSLTRLNRN